MIQTDSEMNHKDHPPKPIPLLSLSNTFAKTQHTPEKPRPEGRQGKFPKKIPAPIWTGATVSWTICSGRSSAGASGHLGFSAHGSYAAMERFLDAYGQRMEFGQIQLMVLSGRQSEGGTAPAAPDPHLDDGAPAGRAAGCPVPGGRRRASAGVAERHGCGGNVFQGGRRCNPRRFGVS